MRTIVANLNLPKWNCVFCILVEMIWTLADFPDYRYLNYFSGVCNLILCNFCFLSYSLLKKYLCRLWLHEVIHYWSIIGINSLAMVSLNKKFDFANGLLRQRMLKSDGYNLTVGGVRVLLRCLSVIIRKEYDLLWKYIEILNYSTTCVKCNFYGYNNQECALVWSFDYGQIWRWFKVKYTDVVRIQCVSAISKMLEHAEVHLY